MPVFTVVYASLELPFIYSFADPQIRMTEVLQRVKVGLLLLHKIHIRWFWLSYSNEMLQYGIFLLSKI